VTRGQGRRLKQLLDDLKETERENSVENSLWKRLWTSLQIDRVQWQDVVKMALDI
jgi:hypothetical protein